MIAETVMDEGRLIAAAAAGSHEAFQALVEPLGRELHLFCYRMLGSFHDAEDAVQEVRIKVWRGLAGFDGRASLRTWMYRIATNVALDALRSQRRRVLPQDVAGARDPGSGLGEQRPDIHWLEPYPDSRLEAIDPHTLAERRESIRFAFIRALQVLPPRQRAALILRDVLDWPAAEVASLLETTVAAINSVLQRARTTIGSIPKHASNTSYGADANSVALAERYARAWEAGDIDAIVSLLTADAVHAMPPWAAWFSGRDALRTLYASYEIWHGRPGPGVFRILQTSLNGELGFAEYCREAPNQPYRPLALTIATLDSTGERMVEKVSFVQSDLVTRMGFPDVLE